MRRPLETVERPSETVGVVPETVKDRSLTEFRAQIIEFVRRFHEENQSTPSLRETLEGCETYRSKIYKAFPGGMREVCEEAGVPFEEARAKQVEKATTSKAREERKRNQKPPEKLDEEIKADEEEARLEEAKRREAAEERAIKARNKIIEIEAKHDPKKIIPYLRTLEPEIVTPFFEICKSAELTPRRAWAEAVKVRGETWEKWGRALKTGDEEPCLKAYVSDVIEAYIPQKRRERALEHHHKTWYPSKCKCGLRFEYKHKPGRTVFSCPNGCPRSGGWVEFKYTCPVCEELGNSNDLFYNPALNLLYCKTCGFEGEVRSPRLEPKGTKAGAFKNPIEELRAEVARLKREKSTVNRNLADLERKCEDAERSLSKIREERKRAHEELDAVRGETAKERRLATSLKRENDREKRKREIYNGMAEFLTNPEMVDGSAIDDIIRTLEVARELRKKSGHVGDSVKMVVEVQDRLLKRIAGDRYVLREEAEKRLGRELAKQRREYDRKLKAKDDTINAEKRKREEAELRLGEAMKIVNSPMVRGMRGLFAQA